MSLFPIFSWSEVKRSEVKVAQSCPTLCNSTVHGILQARILEGVAFPFSRGSSQPKDQTQVFCISGRFFTSWATGEALRILVWVISPFTSLSPFPTQESNRDLLHCRQIRYQLSYQGMLSWVKKEEDHLLCLIWKVTRLKEHKLFYHL